MKRTRLRKRKTYEFHNAISLREDFTLLDKAKWFLYGFASAILLVMYLLVYGFTLPGSY